MEWFYLNGYNQIMILGIDASRMSFEASTGVEFYSKHIIAAILKILKDENDDEKSGSVEVVLYSPKKLDIIFPENEFYKHEERVIPCPRLWTQARLGYEMFVNPPDVLFVPSHVIPIFHPKKTVTMIHDVAFKYTKKAYSFASYHYLNFGAMFACKFAYKIFTPTEAVKQDLIKFYNCNPKKIVVVHHGFETPDVPKNVMIADEKKILAQFGIGKDQKYIFFVGRLEEKKNLVRLINAFAEFSKKNKDYKLLLCGKRGLKFKKIWRAVEKNNLWSKVLMPGYITEEEKNILMKNCDSVAFPSLQEGFGFPVLEAFYYKKPIVVSDIPALREIAEDAVVFVDPYNEKNIADGLKKIKNCEELIKKGTERLKKFTWKKAAEKTLKVLLS
ncbi:TPA: hypothetical protein DCZ16_02355 [Candidatus Peregrinibacteria bacterium]|nr:hypothetical protein [Candidatus Peregrinibacteria bacterium]